MTKVLPPFFTVEAQVLADALRAPEPSQVTTLLRVVVPDACETPARMKPLNDALGEWLLAGPRPWREVEEVRQEFADVFESQAANVSRILEVARTAGFPAEDLARLEQTRREMERLRPLIFDRWQSFSRTDPDEALAEARQGKVHDLDAVIRELQGRGA